MSERIKLEIETPPPPEGWGEVEFRYCSTLEKDARCWTGLAWVPQDEVETSVHMPVARKLPPLWTPPDAWYQMFGDRWLVRDKTGALLLLDKRPSIKDEDWDIENNKCAFFHKGHVRPEVCPPEDIPWENYCFKIGDPKE